MRGEIEWLYGRNCGPMSGYAYVRNGSKSEVGGRNPEVRLTPDSRPDSDIAACPESAKTGA
jgi:hypothetical protein